MHSPRPRFFRETTRGKAISKDFLIRVISAHLEPSEGDSIHVQDVVEETLGMLEGLQLLSPEVIHEVAP